MEDKVLIDWDELKTLRFAAGLLEQVANERDALRLEVKRLQAESAELARMREPVEAVAFHMIEGQKIFDLIATDQISRRVDGEHLGPMGAVEVTFWNTKIGMELERRCEMGGMSVYLRAIAQARQLPEGFALVPVKPTEDQWSGLARDIMMWLDMSDKTAPALFSHLERLGREIPQWLRDESEMQGPGVPSKGTRVAIIYRAMLAAAPQGDSHE